jgi:hypothetical protein
MNVLLAIAEAHEHAAREIRCAHPEEKRISEAVRTLELSHTSQAEYLRNEVALQQKMQAQDAQDVAEILCQRCGQPISDEDQARIYTDCDCDVDRAPESPIQTRGSLTFTDAARKLHELTRSSDVESISLTIDVLGRTTFTAKTHGGTKVVAETETSVRLDAGENGPAEAVERLARELLNRAAEKAVGKE